MSKIPLRYRVTKKGLQGADDIFIKGQRLYVTKLTRKNGKYISNTVAYSATPENLAKARQMFGNIEKR